MTGLDAVEIFAEIVIDLAWAALVATVFIAITVALRKLVRGYFRARISSRDS